jgi:hypothetical protein
LLREIRAVTIGQIGGEERMPRLSWPYVAVLATYGSLRRDLTPGS